MHILNIPDAKFIITKTGKLLLLGIIALFALVVVFSNLISDVSPVLKDPSLTPSQVQGLRIIHVITYALMGSLAITFFIAVALENIVFPYNRFQNFLICLGIVLIAHGLAWI